MGDLADLEKLTEWSKELGAGMLLLNPLKRRNADYSSTGKPLLSRIAALLQPTLAAY